MLLLKIPFLNCLNGNSLIKSDSLEDLINYFADGGSDAIGATARRARPFRALGRVDFIMRSHARNEPTLCQPRTRMLGAHIENTGQISLLLHILLCVYLALAVEFTSRNKGFTFDRRRNLFYRARDTSHPVHILSKYARCEEYI